MMPPHFATHREALNHGHGTLFAVSASRVAYNVRGSHAGTLLARTLPLDLDVRVFAPGHCAQSVSGRVPALFYRQAQSAAFIEMVARSTTEGDWRSLRMVLAGNNCDASAPSSFESA